MMKHIFCDLDGTLLKNYRYILDEDIKALQSAQDKGYTISIATGRLDYEIKMLMQKYNFNGYRISQNGAIICDNKDNLIYKKFLSIKDVISIINALKQLNIIIVFQTMNSYMVEKKIPIIEEVEKTQPFIKFIEKPNIINELYKYNFTAISIWAEENENIEIKKYLDKVLPNNIESYISSKYGIDITSKENSKGNAIGILSEKEGFQIKDIAVIGDTYNDISMFEITENSFVMNDADDFVKSKANFVIDDVKDAVYKFIK